MTTLKLDFSQFNQIVKLNDDANVVLTCLWTQLETFLNNNGLVRFVEKEVVLVHVFNVKCFTVCDSHEVSCYMPLTSAVMLTCPCMQAM